MTKEPKLLNVFNGGGYNGTFIAMKEYDKLKAENKRLRDERNEARRDLLFYEFILDRCDIEIPKDREPWISTIKAWAIERGWEGLY